MRNEQEVFVANVGVQCVYCQDVFPGLQLVDMVVQEERFGVSAKFANTGHDIKCGHVMAVELRAGGGGPPSVELGGFVE